MTRLRSLALRFPLAAALLVTAALLLRLAVPAGFMPVVENGHFIVTICSGYGPIEQIVAMPGMTHGRHYADKADRPTSPCAFADLALQAMGGADPIQLAAAILHAFTAALVLAFAVPPRLAPYLRPPLRGPPLPA